MWHLLFLALLYKNSLLKVYLLWKILKWLSWLSRPSYRNIVLSSCLEFWLMDRVDKPSVSLADLLIKHWHISVVFLLSCVHGAQQAWSCSSLEMNASSCCQCGFFDWCVDLVFLFRWINNEVPLQLFLKKIRWDSWFLSSTCETITLCVLPCPD
jgi:hypothetical protein